MFSVSRKDWTTREIVDRRVAALRAARRGTKLDVFSVARACCCGHLLGREELTQCADTAAAAVAIAAAVGAKTLYGWVGMSDSTGSWICSGFGCVRHPSATQLQLSIGTQISGLLCSKLRACSRSLWPSIAADGPHQALARLPANWPVGSLRLCSISLPAPEKVKQLSKQPDAGDLPVGAPVLMHCRMTAHCRRRVAVLAACHARCLRRRRF